MYYVGRLESGDKFFWVRTPALVIPVAMRTGIHYVPQHIEIQLIPAIDGTNHPNKDCLFQSFQFFNFAATSLPAFRAQWHP